MFKAVPGYEFAEVNELGQIRSSLTKRIYKPYKDKDGYLRCKVWDGEKNRGIYVHRAVALVFVDNPEDKPIVNHKNSVRHDNRIENLEWVTPKENSEHGVASGNFPKGESAFASKYSEEEVRYVCTLLQERLSSAKISRITGIPISTINGIRIGHSWGHISCEYDFKPHKPKLTEDVAREIKKLLSQGFNYNEIVQRLEHPRVNRHTVGNIALGKTFKHLN